MKVIFHIGMGKTGSSSIQATLNQAKPDLKKQGVFYEGMFFNEVAEKFKGLTGQQILFESSGEQRPQFVERIAKYFDGLKEKGAELVIMSNEAFIGQNNLFKDIVAASEKIDFEFHGYVRSPHDWIKSAYAQWGIHDKQNTGPVEPFAKKARTLLGWYGSVLDWSDCETLNVTFHAYDGIADVSEHFFEICGIPNYQKVPRVQTRLSPAELYYRAKFNSLFHGATPPNLFNQYMQPPEIEHLTIDEFIDPNSHDFEAKALINEKQELFSEIERQTGVNLLAKRKDKPPANFENLRTNFYRKIISLLVDASVKQAREIYHLNQKVKRLCEK